MKHIKFPFRNVAVLTLLVSSFIACDKDFANLDTDIVGDPNFGTNSEIYEVIAYNKKLEPVQTNNLPINMLGVYKDPVYGLTTANFVTQLTPTILDPDFGENIELDSVVMTIPYFSRVTGVNADGDTTYKLDSIFGANPIKLSIYENNYFLRSFDPNSEFDDPQKYFSDKSTSITTSVSNDLLEGQLLYENISFVPSANQIKLEDEDEVITERLAPALRIKFNLQDDFWQEKILDKEGQMELSNTNNFHNYFRGIYFKAEAIVGNGNMMLLNFAASNANIVLYYTKDPIDENSTTRIKSTYTLNFNSNRVNFLSNQFTIPLSDGDAINGDEKLYLKGGEGSIALIDLFGGANLDDDNNSDNPFELFKKDFLETDENGEFKRNSQGNVIAKRLVNEANIVFFVDQEATQGQEPERIYLFDATNNTVLLDYSLDASNNSFPIFSKTYHSGRLEREDNEPDGQGIKYKIRITEHINNLLIRDSTNIKLGLSVSGNINLEEVFLQRNTLTTNETLNKVPTSSIISPRGTVLYGNNTTDESKKLYLEIFYSEPNN
uniref:DUF4270 domain-containing protein n=1 Tax=Gelidibacter sp. TaxID=2018083 RepID=UPI0040491615